MKKDDVIIIGSRHVPVEQIAIVEVFDPASNPNLKSDKPWRARLTLLDRENILTEAPPEAFAENFGFRWLEEDALAVNPAIFFKVEAFAPTGDFTPAKPFASRIRWTDHDGNEQSRLLLTTPEVFISQVVRGVGVVSPLGKMPARPRRSRSRIKNASNLEAERG
jgi:hypothetical protein